MNEEDDDGSHGDVLLSRGDIVTLSSSQSEQKDLISTDRVCIEVFKLLVQRLSHGIHAFSKLCVQVMGRQVTWREDLRRVEACDATATVDILKVRVSANVVPARKGKGVDRKER